MRKANGNKDTSPAWRGGKGKRMIEKLNQILQGLLKNPIVDEYDTSDGWHVRKYANGRAEATKTATVSPETTGAAIGNVYVTNVRAWVATTFGNGVWAEPYRIVGGNVVFSVLRGAALVTSWDMPVDVKIEGTWK